MKLLRPTDYMIMPWRNGGGTTTQIHVEGTDPSNYDWRVSIATVASDGPFSRFPGYDRHIMAIEGEGMVLEGAPNGNIDVSPAFVPRSFSGDWDITGRLKNGVTRDFNLIVRRNSFESELEAVMISGAGQAKGEDGWLLVHALKGDGTADGLSLREHDSLLLGPRERVTLVPVGEPQRIAVCRVRPRRQ